MPKSKFPLSPEAKARAAQARAKKAAERKAGYDKVKDNVKQKEVLASVINDVIQANEPQELYVAKVKPLPRDTYFVGGTNPEDFSRNYRLPLRTIQ